MASKGKADPIKRMMKTLRQDNVHTDIFTPRSYQVELLDSSLKRNTIVCLGTGTGKTFIAAMTIKELSHQVRKPLGEGGKRTIFLLNDEHLMAKEGKVISHHTDLSVGEYPSSIDINSWDKDRWQEEFHHKQVLLMTAPIFLNLLLSSYISLSQVNVIIFDDCHHAVENHPYVQIMNYFDICTENDRPRILGLTASVLNSKCKSPVELENNIQNLEKSFRSTAETASDILLADLFSAKPKEIIMECENYEDQTGLLQDFSDKLESALDFISDYKTNDDGNGKDPCQIPKTILMECHNVLHVLGPWCAGRIAETLAGQLTKIAEYESNKMVKMFLKLTITVLVYMKQVMEDIYEIKVQCLEDFWLFMSPKVLRLIQILQDHKPDDNFVIIGGDEESFGGEMDTDDDDDSLNLSDEEFDDENDDNKDTKTKKDNQNHYVAVKRLHTEGTNTERDEEALCGIVFVERRHTAFALNKLIVELCNWDPDLFFVKSHHITGHAVGKSGETEVLYKKQEDILRKFRQRELNLLISTSVLEEGVDVPKCNLILRFDQPGDYRSFVQSKGRARAPKSKFYMLVEQMNLEAFLDNLKMFKGIEQILMGKCHSREVTEDGGDDEIIADSQFYMPVNEEGAPRVTLSSAVGLVNRYCAKLPSDAFTHLTPKCSVEQISSDPPQFVAMLQLPINSPIKEPIKGKVMSTKKLAKMAVALLTCEILHKAGELDNNLLPVGKELIKYEDEENEWEEAEANGQARPGTTKRKQYYYKRIAKALLGMPHPNKPCYMYRFDLQLNCPITEEQNTRGRAINAPEESPRGFGIITDRRIPLVPRFPVFTRSGEVTYCLTLVTNEACYNQEEMDKMRDFHRFVFSRVLRLEKEPMIYDPETADCSYILVPLNYDRDENVIIDWQFMEDVGKAPIKQSQRKYLFQPNKEKFVFNERDFDDAVVMPSYRNIDQPQYFYVAEIRRDLSPKSPFPSPELYDTFEHYYRSKYGLEVTNVAQPLLDVDHTSARLNLLTPRYMNQKGVALPTSSAETRRARRENLQQKQILLPELCDIHPFPASLWKKAVCIPAILYRMNYLLIAEELRVLISKQAHIGIPHIDDDYRFSDLEFGFSTKPTDAKYTPETDEQMQEDKSDHGDGSNDLDSQTGCKMQNVKVPLIGGEHKNPEITKSNSNQNMINDEVNCSSESSKEQFCDENSITGHEIENMIDQSGDQDNKLVNHRSNSSTPSDENDAESLESSSLSTKIVSSNEIKLNKGLLEKNGIISTTHHDHMNDRNREKSVMVSECDVTNATHVPQRNEINGEYMKNEQVSTTKNNISYDSKSDKFNSTMLNHLKNESSQEAEECVMKPSVDQCIYSTSNELELSEKLSVMNIEDTSSPANSFRDEASALGRPDDETIDKNTPNAQSISGPVESADFSDLEKDVSASNESLSQEKSHHAHELHEMDYDSPEILESNNPTCDAPIIASKLKNSSSQIDDPELLVTTQDVSVSCSNETTINASTAIQLTNSSSTTEKEDASKNDDDMVHIEFDRNVDLSSFIGPSPCIFLQTLTMSNANDFFNLERLETIGDSFLKFAITVHLYCTYPGIHEGKLSYLRSKQVSNYNLYKLGKKKGLPECMVAAKFEPTENWLPPGYIIRKEGAYKGLSVHIASMIKLGDDSKNSSIDSKSSDTTGNNTPCKQDSVDEGAYSESKPTEDIEDSDQDIPGELTSIPYTASKKEREQFNRELEEVIKMDEGEKADHDLIIKNLIPYNLQTQHSLPDKSIADCVEALIGCYLTTCGQRAALQFMSWLGLKVLPESGSLPKDEHQPVSQVEKGAFGILEVPHSPLLAHVSGARNILTFCLDGYEAFEKKIQYKFMDRAYLLQAFTHASYHYNSVTDCYQRLEFLGDAILDYVITRHLFEDVKKHSPGILTDLRSALVNNNIFAALAVKWDFHKYFKAVSPQLFHVIDKFVTWQKDKDDEIGLDEEFDDDEHGPECEDIEIPKALGDIFESVAGAIYLDSGMSLDTVWKVYYRMMKPQIDSFTEKIPKSPVRELLEMEPETAKFEKPERTMDGKIRVTVNVVGKGCFRGVGRNYRIAKSAAARRALKIIRQINLHQAQGLLPITQY